MGIRIPGSFGMLIGFIISLRFTIGPQCLLICNRSVFYLRNGRLFLGSTFCGFSPINLILYSGFLDWKKELFFGSYSFEG